MAEHVMAGAAATVEDDAQNADPVQKTTLDYAVVDRCARTGWNTVVFFDWAGETLRYVHERLSGELSFVIYDLDKEVEVGLGELAERAQQEKDLQNLLSQDFASGL
jgi:hypothetical protein